MEGRTTNPPVLLTVNVVPGQADVGNGGTVARRTFSSTSHRYPRALERLPLSHAPPTVSASIPRNRAEVLSVYV